MKVFLWMRFELLKEIFELFELLSNWNQADKLRHFLRQTFKFVISNGNGTLFSWKNETRLLGIF